MKLDYIDNGNEFDFGKTSEDYVRYRDIYPKIMYDKLNLFGIGVNRQKILDIGSGTAVLPINMCSSGADFTATDISPNQILQGKRIAEEKGIKNISFKVCSAENTGFLDDSFDVVTAVQCFHYFNSEKAADEIFRVLKPHGLFCMIFMDWLPYKDEKIMEMESLVLKYNDSWSGGGFRKFRYSYPAWAENRFDIETIHSFNTDIEFSKESWIGRIRSCRGIGASLSESEVVKFENEYRNILSKYSNPLKLKHQIHIEIYRSTK